MRAMCSRRHLAASPDVAGAGSVSIAGALAGVLGRFLMGMEVGAILPWLACPVAPLLELKPPSSLSVALLFGGETDGCCY